MESDRNRPRLCILQKHIQAGKWPAEDSGAIILFLELCAFQLNMRAMVLRGLAKLAGRGKKEQNKSKSSRRKEIIKIRTEIHEVEYRKRTEKINDSKKLVIFKNQ